MNKQDVVDAIAEETGMTKAAASSAVECFIGSVTSALKKGDHVTLSGFGVFTTCQRKSRNGRNPHTGSIIKIASRRVAKFAAGIDLKKAVGRTI